LAQWGGFGSGQGEFNGACAIGLDAGENVYVGDSNNRVQKFTSTGTFLSTFGSAGTADGDFSTVVISTVVDPSGNILVLDVGLERVDKFGYSSTPTVSKSWGELKLRYR